MARALNQHGRLAPRWLYDLMARQLEQVEQITSNRIKDRGIDLDPRPPHHHSLRLVANQCTPEGLNPSTLSLVCQICNYHFVIRIGWTEAHTLCNHGQSIYTGSRRFPPPPNEHLAHHIVQVRSWDSEDAADSGNLHLPLIGTIEYACSVPGCSLQMSLEISEPRLTMEWYELLTDTERIRRLLEEARETQPDRYADAQNNAWCDSGLVILNTYLRNRLIDPETRKISKRNKRFQVVFGRELWSLFRALGYTEETIDTDGVDEDYLVPQPLENVRPNSPTTLGTLRSYIEDMQVEVENHIKLAAHMHSNGAFDPVAEERLQRELHCFTWPSSGNAWESINAAENDFVLLGVLPIMDKSLIAYGFQRQVEAWPSKRRDLVNALGAVSTRLVSEDLQQHAALELSMEESPFQQTGVSMREDHSMVWQAATFFGLDSPTSVSDHAIVAAFRGKSKSDLETAQAMLQVLARFRKSERLEEAVSGQMSIMTALKILEVDPPSTDVADDLVTFFAQQKLESHPNDPALRFEVAEAVSTIANVRGNVQLAEHASQLSDGLFGPAQMNTTQQAAATASRLDIPAGLQNIGNTCYLNSILQYLHTVKQVRDVVYNFPDYRLGLEDGAIADRRLGGNRMTIDRPEAVVAQAFVEELAALFRSLTTTSQSYVRPTQRLANAVLISTDQIARDSKQNATQLEKELPEVLGAQFPAPPPLPARHPPPIPSAGNAVGANHIEHVEDADMVNVSVDAISETASNASSTKTLVDEVMEVDTSALEAQTEAGKTAPESKHDLSVSSKPSLGSNDDVQMGGIEAEARFDDKLVLAALQKQTRSSGTDQQDVEEVMGSIINRLQAAIKGESRSDDGVQLEVLMETFFVTLRNYTKAENHDKYSCESTLDRSITAYPAENGPCTIYEALSRNFDRQKVEGSQILRYSAIGKLPPVLHVLVQRTKQTGEKNGNPVKVDDMLYLDRYMDAEPESDLMKLRVIGWFLQKRLEQISGLPPKPADDNSAVLDRFLDGQLNGVRAGDAMPRSLLSERPASKLAFANTPFEFKESAASSDVTDVSPIGLESLPSLEKIESLAKEKAEAYLKTIDTLFSDHKKEAYRLHAIICHSGRLTAGHYWIWIHDFESDVWRKYNDETITEDASTEDVLKELNRAGEPYYLCYVRDEMKHDLVDVPKRDPEPDTVVMDVTMDDASAAKSSTTIDINVDGMNDPFPPMARQNSPVGGLDVQPTPDELPPPYQ